MKVDLNKEYKTLDGVVLSNSDTDKSPFTVRVSAITALLNPAQDSVLTGAEKASRFMLAEKINAVKEGEVDLKSEEITLLKTLIGDLYYPLIVGQAYKILEGE